MSRKSGELKKFLSDKGYGFIKAGKNDLFFHISDSQELDIDALRPDMKISYETGQDRRGRTVAINVKIEE